MASAMSDLGRVTDESLSSEISRADRPDLSLVGGLAAGVVAYLVVPLL
jgi:hypothetical protein